MHFSPPGIRSQNCCQQKMPQSLTESAFFKKCSITPLLGNFRLYQHFLNLYQWYLSGKMLTMNSQLFSIDFAFGLSLYRSKKKKKDKGVKRLHSSSSSLGLRSTVRGIVLIFYYSIPAEAQKTRLGDSLLPKGNQEDIKCSLNASLVYLNHMNAGLVLPCFDDQTALNSGCKKIEIFHRNTLLAKGLACHFGTKDLTLKNNHPSSDQNQT